MFVCVCACMTVYVCAYVRVGGWVCIISCERILAWGDDDTYGIYICICMNPQKLEKRMNDVCSLSPHI